MNQEIEKSHLDVSQVFLTYSAFHGDTSRTAIALDLTKQQVEALAAQENWRTKIADWDSLRDGDPRDLQVQINRAVNYVQAHRARALLDRVIQFLSEGDAKTLVARLTVQGKHGPEFKTRALTDLVKAIECCQLMSCRALGDTAGERPQDEPVSKGSSIALRVMAAMNAAEEVGLDSSEVIRQQLAMEGWKAPKKDEA